MTVFNRAFWAAVANRAIRTFAQAAAAILTAGGVGIIEADFIGAASAGGLAALLSVLTSIATPVTVGNASKEPELADADLDVDDIEGGFIHDGAAADPREDLDIEIEEGIGR